MNLTRLIQPIERKTSMKTSKILSTALVILLGHLALADESSSTMAIAPQLGTAVFNIQGSGLSAKSGLLAGANFVYSPQGSAFSYETGLDYIQAGAEKDFFFAKTEIKLEYLALPILANWTFYKSQQNTSAYYLKAGGLLTQLLSAKMNNQDFTGGSESVDIKNQVNKNDFLISGGLGGKWTVYNTMQVGVEASYVKGLTDVMKDASGKSEGFLLASSVTINL